MKNFRTVTFNINKNWVEFGDYVVHDRNNRGKVGVKLHEVTCTPARTVKMIALKCRKEISMIESMFRSKEIWGYPVIVAASGIVVPNSSGQR